MGVRITLDEDVYQLAIYYAAGRGITLGAAVGELVRKANRTSGLRVGLDRIEVFTKRTFCLCRAR